MLMRGEHREKRFGGRYGIRGIRYRRSHGGAHHRSQPPLAWVPASAVPTQGSSGQPQHECAAARPLHTQQSIAHMRTHVYSRFMSQHMQQGMSHQEAQVRYMQYERYQVMGGVGQRA